jgi:hypothetical protein
VLVCGITLLIKVHEQGNLDLASAIKDLTSSRPVGFLVVVLFSIVVAATLTQAFAFELIRLLEGYWGATAAALLLTKAGVARHRRAVTVARRTMRQRRNRAFESACRVLDTEAGYGPTVVQLIRWRDAGSVRNARPNASRELRRQAQRINWRDHAPAALLASEDRWRARLNDYPEASRLLPTRLGNVLRASEDALRTDGHDLEGLVMRRYGRIPPRLMLRHDEFRDRLEMYCVLVAAFLALAFASIPLLLGTVRDGSRYAHWTPPVVGASLFIGLAWVSYRAAISSARGYGSVLSQIARLPVDETPAGEPAERGFNARIVRAFSRGA